MKKNHALWAGCLLAGLMSATSCTTDFEDINTNPNKITVGQLQPVNMFEPILYEAARTWQNYTWYWNNELIQFTAFTGGTTRQEHRYRIADQDWRGMWNAYTRLTNNALHMDELAQKSGEVSYQAMALTLKVLFMSNLTDMFGDVPYSEAFKGLSEQNFTPKYDSQQEVYEQMLADLEKANDLYATNPEMLDPTFDGMYGGNMALWRKFNNSLYLRLLCRVSGRSEMKVPERMQNIVSNPDKYPVFASNADNAAVNFTGMAPYVGYFDPQTTTESDFTTAGRKLTEQLIKMTVLSQNGVETYEDPRLAIWGRMNGKAWKGTIAGCTNEQQGEADRGSAYLNFGVLCRTTMPAFLMCYDEVEFILAEAALKGWISGGEEMARSYYEAATRASIEKWGAFGSFSKTPVVLAPDAADLYLASDLASWDKHDNKEELIGNEKFLNLFWVGMEAYHEYRRTGYPELTIGEGTFNDHVLPTRFAYPATSVATNAAHVAEALQRMGGDNDMKTPVWWSLQAIQQK